MTASSPLDRWGDRLPRRLGLWSAVAVVIGSTIGSGIFRTPATIAQRVDDVPLFLLSWVLGGAVAVVNYVGIHRAAILQNVSTALKVGALAALVLLGFALGGGGLGPGPMLAQRASVGLSPFLLAMVAILWAYDGWGDLAFVGGEVKDPERNLPRAMFIGTGSVVALYLAANLVYLHLIPIQQMKGAELVA